MGIAFNNLKMYRKKNGLTQEQTAERLGVSRQTIAKWESGDTLPDIENIVAMADMYDVSVDCLVRNVTNNTVTRDDNGKKHMFGISKINDKGQVTLPEKCRKIFGLKTGDALLILGDEDKGLALVKLGDFAEK
jgi:AbrB family looped-hinge helix DNA binding protein